MNARRQQGFSLVEAMVALVVLSVGMLGIAGLYVTTLRSGGGAIYRMQAVNLAADLADIVHRYGDPSDQETDQLMRYLDAQAKRNLVLTFGGGVQEVQRELIAMFGLGLPRVPR